MHIHRGYAVAAISLLAGAAVWAQGRNIGPEWPVTRADAHRTSWLRTDPNISVENLSKPGFELQWQTKLENAARQSNALLQPVTMNGVGLFSPVAFIAGSSNNLFAVDNDTGATIWQRHFDAAPGAATAACPGGITGAAARIVPPPVEAVPALARGGAGGGGARGAGYRGAVGEPGEGVPSDLAQRPARPGGPGGPGGPGAAGRPGGAGATAAGAPGAGPGAADPAGRGPAAPPRGGGGGLGRISGPTYVVSSDGMLHTIGPLTGKDIQKPAPFLPVDARWSDPIVVDNVLYTTTNGSCGGAPNGVWAVDLSSESKPVTSWKTSGGSPVGPLAITSDGTLVIAIGQGQTVAGGYANAIVALEPKTLRLIDWFTAPAADFVTGPVVLKRTGKNLVTSATRDGRVVVLDASSLGGANHSTPLYASRSLVASPSTFAPEALAVWQEMTMVPAPPAEAGAAPAAPAMRTGQTWVLVPVNGRLAADVKTPLGNGAVTNGAILALKLVEEAGRVALEPAWASHDLPRPLAPVVVNGVVFAASGGGAPASGGSVLYAFDGTTGKELWNSGKTVASSAPASGLWSSNSQMYVTTQDGAMYAFGFALERK